ncbi:ubiquinone/menaquinone biosynthesis C-methylase UbiE [Pseudonocardia sediminis]|uniref:Ubiquinone/menaquinone biosynthesis C-methylase UbiE n=1 Tax=Pseudonocardia sediminis TaxID=1397368 RepID=A0A4Q7UV36_PSEST|nr:class I SAM-dependent methyltransferase [Pseudonocardia sediminis]RZT85646.1 ubiquinone/menaquinone biosynthesis C-methylase UbiE [Pseudonocardia sediminis]
MRTGGDRPRPRFARFYARMTEEMDRHGLRGLRAELVSDLRGEVVEIGCGNGRNFAHYPDTVTAVHAIEPEPHLRALATQAAATAPVPVEVTPGRGEAIPLPDQAVDAAVLCLVLCAMPDPDRTLAELTRVLRPGGRLVFLEHTLAEGRLLRTAQHVADATIWPRLYGGCHTARDPLGSIRAAGFDVARHRYLHYPQRPTVPASPHVLGHAVRTPTPPER